MTEYKLTVAEFNGKTKDEIIERLIKDLKEVYDQLREVMFENVGVNSTHDIERELILQTFDANWQLHIDQMTKLRSSSSLASYAQQNPYQVYVEKGALLFQELLRRISHNAIRSIMTNRYAQKRKPVDEEIMKQHIAAMMAKSGIKQDTTTPEGVPTTVPNISKETLESVVKQIEKFEVEQAISAATVEREPELAQAVNDEIKELEAEVKLEEEIQQVASHAVAKQEEIHVDEHAHKEVLDVKDVELEVETNTLRNEDEIDKKESETNETNDSK